MGYDDDVDLVLDVLSWDDDEDYYRSRKDVPFPPFTLGSLITLILLIIFVLIMALSNEITGQARLSTSQYFVVGLWTISLTMFCVYVTYRISKPGTEAKNRDIAPKKAKKRRRGRGNISSPLLTVVVPPTSIHTSSLIFLHGLGDTGHGWSEPLAKLKGEHVKLICPTAATIPVTLQGGRRMPSWFDLRSLDPNIPEDEEGMKKAAQLIKGLVDQEISSGIPAERIVLGGFSQGGALALHVALTGSEKLGGVIALSAWLPLSKTLDFKGINKVPVLQCHGESDPLIQFEYGQMSSQLLQPHLTGYEFKRYPGLGHSSSVQELEDVKKFLQRVLS